MLYVGLLGDTGVTTEAELMILSGSEVVEMLQSDRPANYLTYLLGPLHGAAVLVPVRSTWSVVIPVESPQFPWGSVS